ncbi:MAG: AAA family ATPase [Betaproteobacteria bacterium]|nr:MAG: AAA family ATPase [Betaproteobacteria bacterium]
MYYSFFGLSQPPFKITPDTEMFFDGGNRGAILEALIYAISQGEGIIKVTGEVGSGKTMLCRMLQTRLPESVETIYLANPSVSRDEILHAIAFEMELTVPKDANRIEAMHRINDYLLERHAEGKHVVLFVEESQSMPLATLEEVRLLSNLETGHHKLLQIVLFGQPELDDNLRLPEIRQLRERITHSFSLTPLTASDVLRYLTFRLRAAGYRGPDLFSRRVVDYISRVSQGLTRRVNIVADKALLAAFADGTHNVSIKHVKAAVHDTEFADTAPRMAMSPLGYITVGLFIGGAVGVTALIAFQQIRDDRADVQNATAASFDTAPRSGQAQVQTPVETRVVRREAAVTQSPTVPVVSASPQSAEPTSAANAGESIFTSESPESDDLLEQRLRETQRWLSETEDSRFTIQLLGSNNPEYLRNGLAAIGDLVELERVFVYRTLANQVPSYTVLLGTYGTRAEAFQEIDALPEAMKANGPYFRTIKGVKAEIARNGV